MSLIELNLLVGQELDEPITSMAMDGNHVWVSAGPNIIQFLRGKEVCYSILLQVRPHNLSPDPKSREPLRDFNNINYHIWFSTSGVNGGWAENVCLEHKRWR